MLAYDLKCQVFVYEQCVYFQFKLHRCQIFEAFAAIQPNRGPSDMCHSEQVSSKFFTIVLQPKIQLRFLVFAS